MTGLFHFGAEASRSNWLSLSLLFPARKGLSALRNGESTRWKKLRSFKDPGSLDKDKEKLQIHLRFTVLVSMRNPRNKVENIGVMMGWI